MELTNCTHTHLPINFRNQVPYIGIQANKISKKSQLMSDITAIIAAIYLLTKNKNLRKIFLTKKTNSN